MESNERIKELCQEQRELRTQMRTMKRQIESITTHLTSLPLALERLGKVPVMSDISVHQQQLSLVTLKEFAGNNTMYLRIYRRLHKYGIAHKECGVWLLRDDIQAHGLAVYVAEIKNNRLRITLKWTHSGVEYLKGLLEFDSKNT